MGDQGDIMPPRTCIGDSASGCLPPPAQHLPTEARRSDPADAGIHAPVTRGACTGCDGGAGCAAYFGGGGASTVRSPLCSGALTTPAASMASINRAARL